MADRALVPLDFVPELGLWLVRAGWTLNVPKPPYQVLHARHPSRRTPLVLYRRDSATFHATVTQGDERLMRRFLREYRVIRERRAATKPAQESSR